MVFRKIAGEAILLPIYPGAESDYGIYTLNEVASRIWEFFDGSRDVEQISEMILSEFEVSRQTAQADVQELVEKLIALNALREV